MRGPLPPWWWQLRQELAEAQSFACALCGLPFDSRCFTDQRRAVPPRLRATIDHIVPRSKGGSDARENLQVAHKLCNQRKGSSAPPPPLKLADEVAAFLKYREAPTAELIAEIQKRWRQ
ncbi:MAG TPA: HNH endonuclease [Candidatus Thermoplasmatota archaeon]|nr:HNH endonuclease [Candidatus Thermoplasmatota archaeon]